MASLQCLLSYFSRKLCHENSCHNGCTDMIPPQCVSSNELLLCEKAFSQWLHWYGFSSVCPYMNCKFTILWGNLVTMAALLRLLPSVSSYEIKTDYYASKLFTLAAGMDWGLKFEGEFDEYTSPEPVVQGSTGPSAYKISP